MKTPVILFWIARIIAALLLLQTLFFKFTAAPESVEIFSKLGMEPWGRIGTGVLELVAALLILIPSTVWFGALLAVGLMAGAVFSHLTVLGIEVQHDGGQLFAYALIVLFCGLFAFWKSKSQVPSLIRKYLPSFLQ